MRRFAPAAAILLAACAGAPAPPDWQLQAHAALQSFSAAYLQGNARVAELEFARAKSEIAATGRPDLLARAELLRCAAEVASLEFGDCPGYGALARDAGAPERAYADFLRARWEGLPAELLPEAQRALLARTPDDQTLPAIKDPFSRLVAAGVLLRAGRLPPQGLAQAVDAASAQGWRRPLLAWLGVMLQRAEAVADHASAANIRRRIALITGNAPGSGAAASVQKPH